VLKLIVRFVCLLGLCLLASVHLTADTLWLSVTNNQGQLILSWPLWAADAVLEQSPVLDPPSWSSVSPALYESNTGAFSYRLSALEGNRFFRVRRLGPRVPGLTGYWQLDEGTGTVAADLTGSGTGLYITNATWAAGRFGPGSLEFNGLDPTGGGSLAWLSNSNYQVLPPIGVPFSISLWFNPGALTIGSQQILGNDANGSNGWHVSLNSVGPGTNYVVLTNTMNGSSLSATGRTLLLPGQWHQLTLTCESNQASLYLDTSLLAQTAATLINEQEPLYFGAVPGISGGFFGRIDEIRIYTNALTTDRTMALR